MPITPRYCKTCQANHAGTCADHAAKGAIGDQMAGAPRRGRPREEGPSKGKSPRADYQKNLMRQLAEKAKAAGERPKKKPAKRKGKPRVASTD